MTTRGPGRTRRMGDRCPLPRGIRSRIAAVAVVLLAASTPASAQLLPGIVGGVGGLVAGAYVSTGAYVFKSRATGWVMHSVEHLIEPGLPTLPLLAGPVAGVLMGAKSTPALGRAGLWGSVGLASGGLVGAAVGHLVWGDREGRWAGAVIGSAAGLLGGAVAGALTTDDASGPEDGTEGAAFALSFGIPWRGTP